MNNVLITYVHTGENRENKSVLFSKIRNFFLKMSNFFDEKDRFFQKCLPIFCSAELQGGQSSVAF